MDAPPVQYVTTSDGYSIAYMVLGSGPPLVWMPSPINHLRHLWLARNPIFSALASRFRLVLYDSRGQGLSSRGLPSGVSPDDYARDLETVVDKLGIRRFSIWANGFMAHTAIKYAAVNPDRVTCLMLQAVSPDPNDQFSTRLSDLAANDWPTFLGIVIAATAEGAATKPTPAQMLEFTTQEDWLARMQSVHRFDVRNILPRISQPTLIRVVIGGAIDWESRAQAVAAKMPNCQIVYLGSGELLTKAEETAQFAIDFASGFGVEGEPQRREHDLSDRELEVLRLLAAGRSNQQIADSLVISLNTVRRHVSNIFAKTGAANRADAVSYAHTHGLIPKQ